MKKHFRTLETLGIPVVVGPNTFNFADVTELLIEHGACVRIEAAEALTATLQRLLGQPELRQRMGEVLRKLGDGAFHRFESLFDASEGRLGVVVTFLSLLELAKDRLIDVMQEAPLSAIYLKARATADAAD